MRSSNSLILLACLLGVAATCHAVRPVSSPRPSRSPAPVRNISGDAVCNQTYIDTVVASLTAKINLALANQSSDSRTNSTKSPTVKFTVPTWCIPGDWFGLGIIPDPIACGGGNTYEGQTGTTTTIKGYGNVQLTGVKLDQTACTFDPSGRTQAASGTWTATATWPSFSVAKTDYWYPMVGGSMGFGISMTLNDLVISLAGSYATNASVASSSACLTAAACTEATVQVGSVDVKWGVPGAMVDGPKVANKIESRLEASSTAAKIVDGINTKIAPEVGKCKTISIS